MKKYKQVTKAEYDKIKQMVVLGISTNAIGKIVDRSYPTVYNVKISKSFDTYHKPEKKVVPAKKVTQTFDTHNSIITMLKTIEHNQVEEIKLLKQIALNTTKRGLFS